MSEPLPELRCIFDSGSGQLRPWPDPIERYLYDELAPGSADPDDSAQRHLPGPEALSRLSLDVLTRHNRASDVHMQSEWLAADHVRQHLGAMGLATFADVLAYGSEQIVRRLPTDEAVPRFALVRALYQGVRQIARRRLPREQAAGVQLREYYTSASSVPLAIADSRMAAPLPAGHRGPKPRTVGEWLAAQDSALHAEAAAFAPYRTRLYQRLIVPFAFGAKPDHTAAERDSARLLSPKRLQGTPIQAWHIDAAGSGFRHAERMVDVLRRGGIHTYSDLLVGGGMNLPPNPDALSEPRRRYFSLPRIMVVRDAVRYVTGHALPDAKAPIDALPNYVHDVRRMPIQWMLPFGAIRSYSDINHLRCLGDWLIPENVSEARGNLRYARPGIHTAMQVLAKRVADFVQLYEKRHGPGELEST